VAAAAARSSGKFEGGKLMLFFGARSKEELPYFGPLQSLPKDFIDIHFAFSRTPGPAQALRAGRDARARRRPGAAAGRPNAYFYVCGLKAMEEGVVLALRDIATQAGLDWEARRRGAEARRPAAPGDLLMAPLERRRRGGVVPTGAAYRRAPGSAPGAP
jgi:hypothetical protein